MIREILISVMVSLGLMNFDVPPAHYMNNNGTTATVHFVGDPNQTCGPAPIGYTIMACTHSEKKLIIMPNPCLYTHEHYGKLMCHEMGHINGWNTTHDN